MRVQQADAEHELLMEELARGRVHVADARKKLEEALAAGQAEREKIIHLEGLSDFRDRGSTLAFNAHLHACAHSLTHLDPGTRHLFWLF